MSETEGISKEQKDLICMMRTSKHHDLSYEYNYRDCKPLEECEVNDLYSVHSIVRVSTYEPFVYMYDLESYVDAKHSPKSASCHGEYVDKSTMFFEAFMKTKLYSEMLEYYKDGINADFLDKTNTECDDYSFYVEGETLVPGRDWLGNSIVQRDSKPFSFRVDNMTGEVEITYADAVICCSFEELFAMFDFAERLKNVGVEFDGEELKISLKKDD